MAPKATYKEIAKEYVKIIVEENQNRVTQLDVSIPHGMLNVIFTPQINEFISKKLLI